MNERPIGVGVLGLGFMGRTHVAAYRSAHDAGFGNKLVAVADRSAELRAGRVVGKAGNLDSGAETATFFDTEKVRAYEHPAELLADAEVELVSICTPTETHVDLAIDALAAGKHVLVEKPVAVRAADVERLAAAANAASTLCMPAMCVRFWPAYAHLRAAIEDGRHGNVRSATFTRLCPPPGWSRDFYGDSERSGGALVDLHAHDADFVLACFGAPEAVTSTGTLDHLTTLYHYPKGPRHVVAEGGWDLAASCDFRMRFTVTFEGATLDFDLARAPEMLCFRGIEREPVALDAANGYQLEVRHLLDCIRRGVRPGLTIDDALLLARVLDAERASLEQRITVTLPR